NIPRETASGAGRSRRGCNPSSPGSSGRSRRRCRARRAFGPSLLPHLHPPLELLDLVALVVTVCDVSFFLPEVLVHARAVFVVFLPVPLVAVLTHMLLRQLRMQVAYIPQNASSFRLIARISSRTMASSWLISFRPPRTRTPKIAGFEVRKLWSGRKSSFAGYAISLRLASSSCSFRSSRQAW